MTTFYFFNRSLTALHHCDNWNPSWSINMQLFSVISRTLKKNKNFVTQTLDQKKKKKKKKKKFIFKIEKIILKI